MTLAREADDERGINGTRILSIDAVQNGNSEHPACRWARQRSGCWTTCFLVATPIDDRLL